MGNIIAPLEYIRIRNGCVFVFQVHSSSFVRTALSGEWRTVVHSYSYIYSPIFQYTEYQKTIIGCGKYHVRVNGILLKVVFELLCNKKKKQNC